MSKEINFVLIGLLSNLLYPLTYFIVIQFHLVNIGFIVMAELLLTLLLIIFGIVFFFRQKIYMSKNKLVVVIGCILFLLSLSYHLYLVFIKAPADINSIAV